MSKKVDEVTDPVTGEVTPYEAPARYRRRDDFIDDLGREIADPRPMQPPVGYKKQPSLFEMVRTATAAAILDRARAEPETFEEADDFDIPDDPLDPHSPWENEFDPPWSEVRAAIEKDRAAKAAAAKKAEEGARPPEPRPPSQKEAAPAPSSGAPPGERGPLDA